MRRATLDAVGLYRHAAMPAEDYDSPGRRRLQAKVLLARTRLHREQGERVRALGTAARVCLADPALAAGLLGGWALRRR
jgi:hypothetical protein